MTLRALASTLMMSGLLSTFALTTATAANEPVTPPDKVPGTKIPGLPTDARNDGAPNAKRETTTTTTSSTVVTDKADKKSARKSTEGHSADNSGVNQRDYNQKDEKVALTAEDQAKGTDADVEMTRKIREAIMKEDNFSTYAQNVKIITLNKLVTLRGPVRSPDEVARIKTIASKVAGPTNVRSELQVQPEKR